MSAKKKCCCTTSVGPCACSAGAPWVAGRSTSVKVQAAFSGISASSPSVPWGAVHFAGTNALFAQPLWYAANAIEPTSPGYCDGHTPTAGELLAYRAQIYNEGSSWRTSGTTQDATSGSFQRNLAACDLSFFYDFVDGPAAIPDFGTHINVTVSSRVNVSFYYDSSANRTYIDVLAYSAFTNSVVNFDVQGSISPSDWCAGIVTVFNTQYPIMTRGISAPSRFVWFSHTSDFAGKVCPNSSIVLANTTPAHIPLGTDSGGLAFGGRIGICSSGTCTLSLIDA